MRIRNVGLCIFVLPWILATSSHGYAWGSKGHMTIETVAVSILPDSPFSRLLKNNLDSVKFLSSMTPDLQWKHGPHAHPQEAQAHFFQMEFFSPGGEPLHPDINFYLAKAGGLLALEKQGTAPWRMEQLAGVLAEALRKPNPDPIEVVQIAATFGHYVGDLGNPLHVDSDYDGAGIGQHGLHSFFESKTVNEIPDDILESEVGHGASLMASRLPSVMGPITAAFTLARAASKFSAHVLADAKESGQCVKLREQFKPIIIDTLAMSAAMLAKLWNQEYIAAGSPSLETRNFGKVPVPEWVPITYFPKSVAIH